MGMRMQELAERSGLPRTTIHHYIREDLLPPGQKTAPNAAQYDETHLERLRLITRLRGEQFGELSIAEVREVLDGLSRGLGLRAAVELVDRGMQASPPDEGVWCSVPALAKAAGVAETFVRELVEAKILGDDSSDAFGPGDLIVTRACDELCSDGGLAPDELAPLAELFREVGNYAATLLEVKAFRSGGVSEAAVEDAPEGARRELSGFSEALLWRAFER